ncbi:conserved hypothetical protein [Talaromyces stipitatus ATCC 10500]|uniref:DDE-1 domain-containing protein n=1 Tax=Talaromyces stipitatus (strain ATCC 10500 / CBS 375.48 / QM 6759 / NRRL 1006) TaxID=441959 RepID=B8LVI1_TALSN|nr:uncharacterized protein TSTA_073860 [Talaromyces stipitatus ATCC 10500]EED24000.1 conserved hypothetical protein [Talaromyces stipitatus ATCC 10500]
MADYLLSQRASQQVGEKWVYNLIQRRPEIESKFSRKYNYERAKCEDPKIIQEYFDRTGFAMGFCVTAKVITGSDRYARPKLLQPGNRGWVTAIEAVGSIEWALPSLVEDLNVSDNGWTTDKIGLEWLKTHFIPLTDGRTLGKYRMLILDGHGSHLTPEFDRICTENNIIPVCMPPHSSHRLQPLDVGCFAV